VRLLDVTYCASNVDHPVVWFFATLGLLSYLGMHMACEVHDPGAVHPDGTVHFREVAIVA
jgi:hypothetical protein